jgi:prepilin-type N-terminal cleavage/methylation domain-containing protein
MHTLPSRHVGCFLGRPVMMRIHRRLASAQHGYSLPELLVVVAIIGILSLVTIPGFTNMYRARKLKVSLTKVANDVRGARQRAVTNSSFVRLAYVPNGRAYYVFESTDEGVTWNALGNNPRMIEDSVYFLNGSGGNAFTNSVDDGSLGELPDIVFTRTGTARVPAGLGKFLLKSNHKNIGKDNFTISIRTTGMVLSE